MQEEPVKTIKNCGKCAEPFEASGKRMAHTNYVCAKCRSKFWRAYYAENKEHLLAQRKERNAKKKLAQQETQVITRRPNPWQEESK